MSYIYIIKNTINQKVYIGKTNLSLEKRFNEHIRDSRKKRCGKRPLYNAMNKYGIDKFSIHLIEETDKPEEREIYWIEKYDSYKNGYNATLGGDSRHYLDYEKIIDTYKKLKNIKLVAKELDINERTVHLILKNNNIKIYKNVPNSKPISMYNLNNVFIKSFESAGEAGRYIIKQGLSNSSSNTIGNRIRECANGKKTEAYGYKWKFEKIY